MKIFCLFDAPFKYRIFLRWVCALALTALGLINVLTILFPVRADHLMLLRSFLYQFAPFTLPFTFVAATRSTITLILSAFLFLTARGIAKGKRRAWQLVLVLLPFSTLVHLLRGWDGLYLFLICSLWYLFLFGRRSFSVAGDPVHLRYGFVLLVMGVLSLTTYGLSTSSSFLLSNHLHSYNYSSQVSFFLRWALPALPWLSAIALFSGLFVLLRPVSASWWMNARHLRIRSLALQANELVGRYGRQTLAFFALAPENLHCITTDEKGFVSYRLSGSVAVALGDSICPPGVVEHATRHFLTLCATNDWSPAFFQVQARHLPTYRALGLHAFKIGEEGLLNLSTFTLSGSAMANVRTSMRRAKREGVNLSWYEGALPFSLLSRLQMLSLHWLEHKGASHSTEMGFSMGRLSEVLALAQRADQVADQLVHKGIAASQIPRFQTVVATSSEGDICAFATFTPIYGEYTLSDDGIPHMLHWGWALDLVRRVSSAPPGITELLLVSAIERFRDCGAHLLSLGMVALADTHQEMTPVQRFLLQFIVAHTPFLRTHLSLFDFKQKFHPQWESRYILTPGPLTLLKCTLVLMKLATSS